MAKIDFLIDKKDNNEYVRDQVAAILAIEKENQKILAVAAGKDPALWDFSVFIERAKPWELLSELDGTEAGELSPGLVNVFFESDNFDNAGSNLIETQNSQGRILIDCYGFKNSKNEEDPENPGEFLLLAGDEYASYEVDRVARLCRNILMAGPYTYLGFDRGQIVQSRAIIRREKFFPDQRQEGAENIIGERLTLRVNYIEQSPQSQLEVLDILIAQCKRTETGEVYFDYEA